MKLSPTQTRALAMLKGRDPVRLTHTDGISRKTIEIVASEGLARVYLETATRTSGRGGFASTWQAVTGWTASLTPAGRAYKIEEETPEPEDADAQCSKCKRMYLSGTGDPDFAICASCTSKRPIVIGLVNCASQFPAHAFKAPRGSRNYQHEWEKQRWTILNYETEQWELTDKGRAIIKIAKGFNHA